MTTPNISRDADVLGAEMENYVVKFNEKRFNQNAGLPFDEDEMKSISEVLVSLSSEFLNTYTEPRPLFLNCIALISQARKLPITLEIYEKRISEIISIKYKINGKSFPRFSFFKDFSGINISE